MPTTPMEIARIGIGAAMLVHYVLITPYLLDFWGEAGFMPRELVYQFADSIWSQSVFFYFTAPWQWYAFHGFFLLACVALMLGWRTSWVKWIVLIGQISYSARNPIIWYGVDKILCQLLIVMCVAPIGRAMKLFTGCAPCAQPSAAISKQRCRPTPAPGRAPASG